MPGWMVLSRALTFVFALETGYDPGAFWGYDIDPVDLIQTTNQGIPLYTDLLARGELSPWGADFPSIFVAGNVRTDFYPDVGPSFVPFQMTYGLGAGVRWGAFELGWKHYCYHPVTPFATLMFLDSGVIPIPRSEGALDDFYLRVSVRTGRDNSHRRSERSAEALPLLRR